MTRIHLSKADVTSLEEEYVLDAMRSGWIAPAGPHVDAFEAEMAERIGVRGALALTSGTAALHLALLAIGARPGTVVALPSMTFAASANAITYTGAEPVFVDSQLSDGNIDPGLLVEAVDTLLAEGATIAAVMTVDLFGRCAAYDQICDALADRGIPLIEDAAEAMGARSGDRMAGSFGAAAVLSFNGNKILTTSGGGMLLSNDLELLNHCRYLAGQARQPVSYYEHTEVGYNYRLSNVLAALGRAQLRRLDDMIARRRCIRQMYSDGLASIPGVQLLPTTGNSEQDNCWLTSLILDPAQVTISADSLIKSLAAQDIEARHLWKPMHLQPLHAGTRSFLKSSSDYLFDNGVSLPSGTSLSNADVGSVISAFLANVAAGLSK